MEDGDVDDGVNEVGAVSSFLDTEFFFLEG